MQAELHDIIKKLENLESQIGERFSQLHSDLSENRRDTNERLLALSNRMFSVESKLGVVKNAVTGKDWIDIVKGLSIVGLVIGSMLVGAWEFLRDYVVAYIKREP